VLKWVESELKRDEAIEAKEKRGLYGASSPIHPGVLGFVERATALPGKITGSTARAGGERSTAAAPGGSVLAYCPMTHPNALLRGDHSTHP
jgi:hypothetical protein